MSQKSAVEFLMSFTIIGLFLVKLQYHCAPPASLIAACCVYHYIHTPILFGRHHHRDTGTCLFYVDLPRYHLTFLQRHIRYTGVYKASQWWNGLPNNN